MNEETFNETFQRLLGNNFITSILISKNIA